MRYLGGKFRIAKPLSAYLNSRREGRTFVEPFCGGLNVTEHLDGERVACDANPALISLYVAMRDGWEPPDIVSEKTYAAVKAKQDMSDPMTAFVGFGCTYSGMWFGSFAKDNTGRNYAMNAKRALLRQIAACSGVLFHCADYASLSPDHDDIVYLDPPYAGTAGYKAVGQFDTPKFWGGGSGGGLKMASLA